MLAFFDFLVGAMAALAAISARRGKVTDAFTQTGYATIAAAAFIGTAKFLGVTWLATHHAIASHIAAVVGVPFAAVGFFLVTRETRIWASSAAGIVIITGAAVFWTSPTYGLLIGVVAQAIWLWGGWLARPIQKRILLRVIISVVLTSVAGLVFAPPGIFYGIEKENIFHGLLALALMQQAYAFSSVPKNK